MPNGSLSAFKATLARKKARDVKKKSMFEKSRGTFKTSKYTSATVFPKLSGAKVDEVKQGIRKKLTSQRKRSLIVNSLFIIVFAIITVVLFLKYLL